MRLYILGFMNGSYFDATIILENGKQTITITGWVVFTLTGAFISFLMAMFFVEIAYVRFIISLRANDITYCPLHPDESGGVSYLVKPSINVIYAAMAIAVIFLVFVLQDYLIEDIQESNRLYLLSIYAPSVLVLFGVPIFKLRQLMIKCRHRYLAGVATVVENAIINSASGKLDEVSHAKEYLSLVDCPCFGPKPSSLDEKRLQPFFLS